MVPVQLTILIPGMSSPPKMSALSVKKKAPRFFEFEKLLSRSVRSEGAKLPLDAQLFQLFSMDFNVEEDLPMAAISYLWDTGEVATNDIFHADPVHLQPNRDQLVLFDVDITQFNDDEYDLLAKEFCAECRGDDWKIIIPNRNRWYLEFQVPLQVRTSPVDEVVGKSIDNYLPSGVDAQKIRTIFNEAQMIMHSIMALPTLQGQVDSLLINSLWFWGGGRLPETSNKKDTGDYWAEIWSDSASALGLAKLNGVKTNTLPRSAHQLLEQELKPGKHLLVLEGLSPKSNSNNIQRWWDQAELINKQWIAPVVNALNDGELLSLTIIDNEGQQYFATKRKLSRWWVRTKPLYSI